MNPIHRSLLTAIVPLAFASFVAPAAASTLPPEVQAKVEETKKRLTVMAADPAVVAFVKEANGRDAGGMNNGKWSDLADTDPFVKALLGNKVSLQITKWEAADTSVNKLVLRDEKGNLLAASTRPLLFNNASRPQFSNPMKGQAWAASEIKPDPSTQIPGVHVGVPVLDGGKPIGVLHAGMTAK